MPPNNISHPMPPLIELNLNPKPKPTIKIRSVWASNLESEFKLITKLIDHYPFISMDTEFPGVIYKPYPNPHRHHHNNNRPTSSDNYRLLKSNVDALNLIQVGLTLTSSSGDLPFDHNNIHYIWEFNFRDFDINHHPYSPDSIDLLRRQGIDFSRNRIDGIDSSLFAELLMSSGLICNGGGGVTWVTFHSGYDFGYLVKILTQRRLPSRIDDFLELVSLFFGNNVFDVKHMIRSCNGLYGGLDRIAKSLSLDRAVGKCHQAGSDSLLTWHAFEKIREVYFKECGVEKFAGVLFGLELGSSCL